MPGANDVLPGDLVASGSVAHGGLTPWRLGWHARRRLALATTVRVVARRHRDASGLRSAAHVPRTTGLANALVFVIEVADLADRGHAAHVGPPDLTTRHADLRV